MELWSLFSHEGLQHGVGVAGVGFMDILELCFTETDSMVMISDDP
jgi:hypothetical protein